jgi:uncharacterized protein (DUF433 family)
MAKKQIRVSAALADLRAGMNDSALMAKFQLDSKGLQSLFSKLVRAGLITFEELDERMPGFMGTTSLFASAPTSDEKAAWELKRRPVEAEEVGRTVNANEAVADIRSGLEDTALMEKYRLTAKGLQDLFGNLVDGGLLDQSEIDERMPAFDSTVDLLDIINELQRDDSISPPESEDEDRFVEVPATEILALEAKEATELETIAEVRPASESDGGTSKRGQTGRSEPSEPEVRLEQVIGDIRLGLSDTDLMHKHLISYEKLQLIFERLLAVNAVTKGELYGRASLHLKTRSLSLGDDGEVQEHFLAFPVPIYDARIPSVIGRIRNLTETDVGTIGIRSSAGEVVTFVVCPEKFVSIEPFKLQAKCRWSREESEGTYAGFEIVGISQEESSLLTQLVQSLTISSSEPIKEGDFSEV